MTYMQVPYIRLVHVPMAVRTINYTYNVHVVY